MVQIVLKTADGKIIRSDFHLLEQIPYIMTEIGFWPVIENERIEVQVPIYSRTLLYILFWREKINHLSLDTFEDQNTFFEWRNSFLENWMETGSIHLVMRATKFLRIKPHYNLYLDLFSSASRYWFAHFPVCQCHACAFYPKFEFDEPYEEDDIHQSIDIGLRLCQCPKCIEIRSWRQNDTNQSTFQKLFINSSINIQQGLDNEEDLISVLDSVFKTL